MPTRATLDRLVQSLRTLPTDGLADLCVFVGAAPDASDALSDPWNLAPRIAETLAIDESAWQDAMTWATGHATGDTRIEAVAQAIGEFGDALGHQPRRPGKGTRVPESEL